MARKPRPHLPTGGPDGYLERRAISRFARRLTLMPVLAVIPARLGATRLPRKPLRLLGGAPLITRVYERVRAMDVADVVVVATDSPEVATAVSSAGGRAIMTSTAHRSGTDRVAEVAALSEFHRFEVILNVQGDEPFVDESALSGALAMVTAKGFLLGTAASIAGPEILESPHVVKVVCADDGGAMYFSRAAVPHLRDAANRATHESLIRQHIGIYAYGREALARWVSLPLHSLEEVEQLEQLRPLAAGMRMGVATVATAPIAGIDTEQDLERANVLWNDLYAGRT